MGDLMAAMAALHVTEGLRDKAERDRRKGGKEDWHGCPRESFDREHDRLLGPN